MEVAKAAGFAVSVEELKRAQAEISDEELEKVAGGGNGNWFCGDSVFIPSFLCI